MIDRKVSLILILDTISSRHGLVMPDWWEAIPKKEYEARQQTARSINHRFASGRFIAFRSGFSRRDRAMDDA
ncbi:MAG: hypothetical protein WDM76_09780 [Limisphaerales bacterium]